MRKLWIICRRDLRETGLLSICQECDISAKELFAMTPSEIDENVVERMLEIESELETDDKGKDIANERVEKAGNILDVFSHW